MNHDVESRPTCIVVPKGYANSVTIRGKDYEYDGEAGFLSNTKNPLRGCGPFLHDDETDRPPAIFNTDLTVHMGPKHKSYLLLPVIPNVKAKAKAKPKKKK
jgi:hypothetical protein